MQILTILNRLDESYADAKRIFTKQAIDPEQVQNALDEFKKLKDKNLLTPEEKDLSKWIRKGWNEFGAMLTAASNRKSKKQERKDTKKDCVTIFENDKWLVVVPLTAGASCFYGKNTEWCTAADNDNRFYQYFKKPVAATLVYFINKKTHQKWAAAVGRYDMECFDQNDHAISYDEIDDITGISEDKLRGLLHSYSSKIDPAKELEVYPLEKLKEFAKRTAAIIKSQEYLTTVDTNITAGVRYLSRDIERIKQEMSSYTKSDQFKKNQQNLKLELNSFFSDVDAAVSKIDLGSGRFYRKVDDEVRDMLGNGYDVSIHDLKNAMRSIPPENYLPDRLVQLVNDARNLRAELKVLQQKFEEKEWAAEDK